MAHIEGGRPHPRTMGVTEEGEIFKMFGTQQLKFIDPAKPALGVKQIDVGKSFSQLTTSLGFDFGTPTTPNVFTPTRPQTTPTQEICTLDDDKPFCGFTELMGGEKCECPNWFGWEDIGKERGCECEACKNGTGQCSDKVPKCDAWDLGCEVTGGNVESTFFWVKIILAVIGIGVLLWLLKPLFNMITATKKASAIKTVYA